LPTRCAPIAPDTEAERQFLPDPATLKDRLWLADRGYPSVPYCEAVRAQGGSFIVRLTRRYDPWVGAAWVEGVRAAVPTRIRLSHFLAQHAGHRLDLDVEFERGRRVVEFRIMVVPGRDAAMTSLCTNLPRTPFSLDLVARLYRFRWQIGVSRQGHIVQSVKDRPRPKDSGLVAWEAPWRESKTAEPSDNMLRKEYAQRTRLQRTVNADVASLHEIPVAETVDNVRKQQGLAETSPMRQPSPAGYQRRHGVKDDVATGEALGARRRNLVEEMPAITVSGKCWQRFQGGGSGRSTRDGRAAKRARREGPGPVSMPSVKGRQG
jgi:hypothetical protein